MAAPIVSGPPLLFIQHQGGTMRDTSTSRDERGASGVEYGLLLAGIFVTIAGAVYGFGGAFKNLSDENCDGVVGAIKNSDSCRP